MVGGLSGSGGSGGSGGGSGCAFGSGPFDTTMVTVSPRLPDVALWLMTVPAATVSLYWYSTLAAPNPAAEDVYKRQGLGLMVAADLAPEAPAAPDVVARGLDAGVLLNATGPHTLRFLPPLVCARRHCLLYTSRCV